MFYYYHHDYFLKYILHNEYYNCVNNKMLKYDWFLTAHRLA